MASALLSWVHSRLGDSYGLGAETQTGEERGGGGDGGYQSISFGAEFDGRARWGDGLARGDRACGVTAGGQASGFAGRVLAADLGGPGQKGADAESYGADQSGQGDGGLDRHRARIAAESACAAVVYTLVLSALSMMPVSALTMLSPVTTP